MRHLFFILTLAGILAGACDRVEDRPEPNYFDTLVLKPVAAATVVNGPVEIDIVGANQFTTDVTLRIKTQPQKGNLTLDAISHRFVYQPIPNTSGYDTAVYEACMGNNCKEGLITIFVEDTTSVCVLQPLPTDWADTVEAGIQKVLNVPTTFDCGARITSLSDVANPQYFSLDAAGHVVANFPADHPAGTFNVELVVCTPDGQQCQTTSLKVVVQNHCADVFQPHDLTIVKNTFIVRFSVRLKEILATATTCDSSQVDESTFQIVGQPAGAIASVSQAQDTAISTPGPLFLKLERLSNQPATYDVQYSVQHLGTTKTAHVFYSFQ